MSTQNFSERLYEYKGRLVKIFLPNGQNAEGTLLDITDLHVALGVDAQIVYYVRGSIQGFSISTKSVEPTSSSALALGTSQQLYDELSQMKYDWVTVTSADGQKYGGFLSRVHEDHIVVISKEDQLVVPFTTISQFQRGEIKEEKSSSDEDASDKAEEDAEANSVSERKAESNNASKEKKSKESKKQNEKNEVNQFSQRSESRSNQRSESRSKRKKRKRYESSCGCNHYAEPYFPYERGNGIQKKESKAVESNQEEVPEPEFFNSRAMLDAQYSSLERQARRNMKYVARNKSLSYEEQAIMESQYASLMKHAGRHKNSRKYNSHS